MDRLRHLMRAWPGVVLCFCALVSACEDPKPAGPAPSRFAAVKAERTAAAAGSFCEKSFPASGPGARKHLAPPHREVPGLPALAEREAGWTWLNLWATWCTPCMAEMGLLTRWQDALRQDGVPVHLALLSVDSDEEPLREAVKKPLPGRVEWLRSPDDLGALLESLGVDKASPIPVHALIDPAGMVRCVRVGAVHEGDYGAVKALLQGG